jgi:prepilin-type N-terminal cleavage/methylation domain-containing protein
MRQPIKPREIYMNIKQMKSMISKFRSADLSVVKDADMRAKAEKLQAKQAGFTLLELLVVVAILAIIAGAVISSLDGQEELAAQKTTVHTMAALEEGFQIYRVSESRRLPGEMDSLICSTGIQADYTMTPAQLTGGTSRLLSANDANSNVARVNGGLTGDMADKLVLANVTSGALSAMEDEGLTSLRYVNDIICNGTAGETLFTQAAGFDEDIVEPELVDVTKPSLIFRSPITEDDDWEFGAGATVDLTARADTDTAPIAFYSEPAELGLDEEAIVAVFGVGPDSDIVGEIVARAPQDGNAGPDKYSNFSVAVKVADCPTGTDIEDVATTCAPALWENVGDDMKVVAILDAGGDAYDDEIAEAQGNEEE